MIFSLLKRLPLFSPPLVNVIPSPSQRLLALAQQLRHHKPPSSSWDDNDDRTIEEAAGKVVSLVGFQEPATRVAQNSDDFRSKRAAVLICLFEGDAGDLRVILTKRSARLSSHSGEVSLPGGKADEGDKDDGDTATREAKEEIGLDPSLVNVITVLEPFLSKHLLRVVPVIGILHDRKHLSLLRILQKWMQYLMLPWKCSSRMKIEAWKRENGWERSIFFTSSITKPRIRESQVQVSWICGQITIYAL
ncbi:hypothetical protein V6N12_062872 [Hibiscus sabdariffa]|uniref:Nudix hydrolase domain-containing protein n=1 Tax=Hibiscus sabdariffa TaxID=183260 RepID=A0ABR2FA52_9ROSI